MRPGQAEKQAEQRFLDLFDNLEEIPVPPGNVDNDKAGKGDLT